MGLFNFFSKKDKAKYLASEQEKDAIIDSYKQQIDILEVQLLEAQLRVEKIIDLETEKFQQKIQQLNTTIENYKTFEKQTELKLNEFIRENDLLKIEAKKNLS